MAAPVPPNGARILVCDGEPQTHRALKAIDMPILLLSGVVEGAAKVRAFEAGADDYLTKPFGRDELVARLRALLRRDARGRTEPKIVIDELELDLGAHTVAHCRSLTKS
jgi:two-component system, OmpR family, KDP operon response regulator KdpE